ncbi:MAG: copper oxidase [bacterium]
MRKSLKPFRRSQKLLFGRGVFILGLLVLGCWGAASAQARTLTADVVALDQVYFYNRFGSYNPAGMIYALRRDVVDSLSGEPIGQAGTPGQVMLRPDRRPRPLVLRANVGDTLVVRFTNLLDPVRPSEDSPATRFASMVAVGVTTSGDTGISGVGPGDSTTYTWSCEREGTHLIFSNAAPAGGEGDGGSAVQGLFGALHCEPRGSKWYRSQVQASEMAQATVGYLPTGHPRLDYEAIDPSGTPILNMLKGTEIVHSDLNALIVGFQQNDDGIEATAEGSFREFTAIYHDEIKAVQAFALLEQEQLKGVRDGFAINYGSSGMGPILLANRQSLGPAKDCVGCSYEEFFLSSWVNGDPALRVEYEHDPANVHHSYLNDNVKFRVLHGGVKETHVHHLHGHQWLGATENRENSTYLDSQTLGPMQNYTTEILYGGSGNRNKTPGDAIFHCHLYPHFAQGMWALWRIHDTFEDGSRRLPDGEHGPGTDPLSGLTSGGTPIPAVVPMPQRAMVPMPTYGPNAFPGYPFYIAGRAGHRPPQPPLEPVVDAGLPRHIMTGGARITKELLGREADFSVVHTALQIQLLEKEGTTLERAAMDFHAAAGGHPSMTPEGNPATLAVNGLPPVPGAPFADPCPPGKTTGTRNYHVSAIQLDLLVNSHGWHDPQARINVLDSDVELFEGKSTTASPFFFRANSGECINFFHTNRTPRELERDDYQVRSPTDTIGQHIHLVKFDLTSSDGSANGWNYEDGTLARQEVEERIRASREPGGWALDPQGNPVQLFATGQYQTTVQRWWADPLLNQLGKDRTIRTAFTHDHFSPSSIQQHGFYSALLIEPEGSQWLAANSLEDLSQPMDPARGVGTQMRIVNASQKDTHPDYREFALAVADFAIVYDPTTTPRPGTIRPEFGNPVNPPLLPEAISAEDPGTFLVNYRHEPIPLRVGLFDPQDGSFLGTKPGKAGDMAYVFDSSVHGDPFTEIFKAYEGDRVVLRLIQGAQEEQHVVSINAMRWSREQNESNSLVVGAQELGLSEHFELAMGLMDESARTSETADYLYHFNATDDFWNGAWGFIRSFSSPDARDPATGQRIGDTLQALPENPDGRLTVLKRDERRFLRGCPPALASRVRRYQVEAWAARDLLPAGAIRYNSEHSVEDPSGMLFIHAADREAYMLGLKEPEPLVIRANAGECIEVTLTNRLPGEIPDHEGDARLVPITAMEADMFRPSNRVSLHPQLVDYDPRRGDGVNVGWNTSQPGFPADQTVGPGQSITYRWYAGVMELGKRAGGQDRKRARPREYGPIPLISGADVIKHPGQGLVGALIIEPRNSRYRDPVTGAALSRNRNYLSARIQAPVRFGGNFLEHVLVYQAGLNLLKEGLAMPEHFMADDAEDSGEMGINYKTEPFTLRLGLEADQDTNDTVYPQDFFLGPISTPVLTAKPGERVRFRVLFPAGPARQTSFFLYGHDYPDAGRPGFLSSGSSLLAPGKAVTAEPFGGAKAGTWIFRAGPNFHFSRGMWGRFEVR